MKTAEEIEFWIRRMLCNMFDRPGMYDVTPDGFAAKLSTALWAWAVVTDREDAFIQLEPRHAITPSTIDEALVHYRLFAPELGFFERDTESQTSASEAE